MTKIIFGPPGCGKTTSLLDIVEQELERGTPPDRIGYVTYTKRGAEEAISRACKKFNLSRKDFPYFRTLHSLCYRTLELKRSSVLDGPNLQEFADWVGVKITGRFSEDGLLTGMGLGDRAIFMDNLARQRRKPLREIYDNQKENLPWDSISRISRALSEFKQNHYLYDYTAMLEEFISLSPNLNLEVLIGDEAQDMSILQWCVFDILAKGTRLCVVAGDDDQAIYNWAGAESSHLLTMEGERSVLGQSWRVPLAVQGLATKIVDHISYRQPKNWLPRIGSTGEINREQTFDSVNCDNGEILILARNTYILRDQVEPVLRHQGIIYERNGHSSVHQDLLHTIEDWEKLRKNEKLPASNIRDIYSYMSSGLGVSRGHKTLPGVPDELLLDINSLRKNHGLLTNAIWHDALDRIPLNERSYILSARRRGEKLKNRPRVRLSTIHGAKGGEADHVVLFREMSRLSRDEIDTNPDDERRVWYVGVTRSREKLTVVNGTKSSRMDCPWI